MISNSYIPWRMAGIPPGATLVCKFVNQVATGTAIYTVTAGKTFYVTGVAMSNSGAGCTMGIDNDGTDMISMFIGASVYQLFSGGILFSVAATKIVKVETNSGAATANAAIWGYEL